MFNQLEYFTMAKARQDDILAEFKTLQLIQQARASHITPAQADTQGFDYTYIVNNQDDIYEFTPGDGVPSGQARSKSRSMNSRTR